MPDLTTAQWIALGILAAFAAYVALYLIDEAAASNIDRHVDRALAPDPLDTITRWRDEGFGRDLREMSTWDAAAVVGMAEFFASWDALVEAVRDA